MGICRGVASGRAVSAQTALHLITPRFQHSVCWGGNDPSLFPHRLMSPINFRKFSVENCTKKLRTSWAVCGCPQPAARRALDVVQPSQHIEVIPTEKFVPFQPYRGRGLLCRGRARARVQSSAVGRSCAPVGTRFSLSPHGVRASPCWWCWVGPVGAVPLPAGQAGWSPGTHRIPGSLRLEKLSQILKSNLPDPHLVTNPEH